MNLDTELISIRGYGNLNDAIDYRRYVLLKTLQVLRKSRSTACSDCIWQWLIERLIPSTVSKFQGKHNTNLQLLVLPNWTRGWEKHNSNLSTRGARQPLLIQLKYSSNSYKRNLSTLICSFPQGPAQMVTISIPNDHQTCFKYTYLPHVCHFSQGQTVNWSKHHLKNIEWRNSTWTE